MRKLLISLAAFGFATVAHAGEGRAFSVGGEVFAEQDIVDARALPGMDGGIVIMITFSDAARERLEAVSITRLNDKLPMVLDSKVLAEPVVKAPVTSGVVEIPSTLSLKDATALAKIISGKDPLPESLEE
jgi:preprotein translocase subunit SecD